MRNMFVQIGVSRAMSALRPFTMEKKLKNVYPVGINPGKAKLSLKPISKCYVVILLISLIQVMIRFLLSIRAKNLRILQILKNNIRQKN